MDPDLKRRLLQRCQQLGLRPYEDTPRQPEGKRSRKGTRFAAEGGEAGASTSCSEPHDLQAAAMARSAHGARPFQLPECQEDRSPCAWGFRVSSEPPVPFGHSSGASGQSVLSLDFGLRKLGMLRRVVSAGGNNSEARSRHHTRTPAALSPARQLPAGPPASPPVDLGAGFESLRSLLLDAMEGISFLTYEVTALRDANARLRHEQKRDAELQAGAMAVLRSENNASPKDDVPPSGINSARPKARTPALTGASETCKLIVAPPSTRRRALFVTKLNPDTSCEDISSHLSSVGVEEVECRKLKTRYDSYASFHVSVAAKDFDKLSDPTVWPKSCLLKAFRGALREDLHHRGDVIATADALAPPRAQLCASVAQ
ncbi:hypothetical protein HPB47_018892 [Ixodes persulcatus]|uniref:Uncharacterized protein n=1 Tax=Ixodes persulcatus TaxID=34615 RepID=A0AC60QM37_IXOPE|nr:hypothetical protein HPB47_018892 [Ixodes persulcatus]